MDRQGEKRRRKRAAAAVSAAVAAIALALCLLPGLLPPPQGEKEPPVTAAPELPEEAENGQQPDAPEETEDGRQPGEAPEEAGGGQQPAETSRAEGSAVPAPTPAAQQAALPSVTPRPLWTHHRYTAADAQTVQQEMASGRMFRKVDTRRNYVAITVDDGPTEGCAMMMDVFKEKGCKATFFMVGYNIDQHPQLVARMVEEGHDIGNHTNTHLDMAQSGPGASLVSVNTCNDKLTAAGGLGSPWVRPPYGSTSGPSNGAVLSSGYSLVMWSVDTRDWSRYSHHGSVETALTAEAGDIILIHSQSTSREELETIIDGLRAKGLEPVNLTTLLATADRVRMY